MRKKSLKEKRKKPPARINSRNKKDDKLTIFFKSPYRNVKCDTKEERYLFSSPMITTGQPKVQLK